MKKANLEKATKPEINWDEPQWVYFSDMVVLTTGEEYEDIFSGMCMPCSTYPNGRYSKTWEKSCFTRLTQDIQFIISNED